MRKLTIAGLLFISSSVSAETVQVKLIGWHNSDYYSAVQSVAPGPYASLTPARQTDEATSHSFRIATLQSEEHISVLVEEITIGEEGCCSRIAGVKEIDLTDVTTGFKIDPVKHRGRFFLLEWKGLESFSFCFRQQEFVASGLTGPTTAVTRVAPNKAFQPTPSRCALGRG